MTEPLTKPAANGRSLIAFQNILLATDFSTPSAAALHYAAALARRYDARVFVAHVIRPDVYQLVPPEALTITMEQTRRYAEQQLANLLISGHLRDIPHQVLLGTGELWPVLSDMIERNDVDLVVAGTHGRTGVRKLLLGSVAEEIFRLAPCPVLTVGPRLASLDPQVSHYQAGAIRRILFATDFTVNSERASGIAFSLAQENQAHLTLLHAVQDVSELSPHNQARLTEFFTRKLRELLPPEAEFWCEPEFVVEFGSPADAILKVAAGSGENPPADLIILGVRKAATFPGHLPPATAYKVVCQATCPVLTVRG
jgi:nucleotide-binding universal stress UspA family protein